MPSDGSISLDAPAKINLTLEILGKRADGYHDLCSVLMPITLADVVTVSSVPRGIDVAITAEPDIDTSILCPARRNLAFMSASLMRERYKVESGAQIEIHKRIPICAGLGGGSADAAAVIRGLNQLWGLGLTLEEMMDLGAELGCDVPAQVHGGAVLMEGRGERVAPLLDGDGPRAAEGFWLVLANAGIACHTADIYKKWKSGLTAKPGVLHNMRSSIRAGDVSSAALALFNGLERAVFREYPAIQQTAETLKQAGCLGVLLSGSGACVFGLVRDMAHGEEVCRHLDNGIWRMLARTCPVV